MWVSGVSARDEGIEALNLMREPHLLKKIERSINGWWLCGAVSIEISEQIVGLGGFVAFHQ